MSETAIKEAKQNTIRIILLVAQILLPFGLYLALEWGNLPLAIVIATLLCVSMAVLVLFG